MNEGKKVLVIQGLQLEKKYFSATMYWVIVVQCSSHNLLVMCNPVCKEEPIEQRKIENEYNLRFKATAKYEIQSRPCLVNLLDSNEMRLGEILKSAASKKKTSIVHRVQYTGFLCSMAPTYDVTAKCPCTTGAGVVT